MSNSECKLVCVALSVDVCKVCKSMAGKLAKKVLAKHTDKGNTNGAK